VLGADRDRFVAFLVEAKRSTYAAGGGASPAVAQPLLPGSHQLEFQQGDLLYRDIYFGNAFFVGQETVSSAGFPVWSMCYAGGFTRVLADGAEQQEIGTILQSALREVPAENPYRGPLRYQLGAYAYKNEVHGELEWFWGVETISRKRQVVYELRYSGGALE
jgi:hypothetical protein